MNIHNSQTDEDIHSFQHDGDICPCCGDSFLTHFVPVDPLSKADLICGSCNRTFARIMEMFDF